MLKKLMISIVMLMMSHIGFSMNSKSEWVSLCKNATGERRHTCDVIRQKAGVTSSVFSGNWKKTFNKLAAAEKLRLNLENKNISDLSPLAKLNNLTELYLDTNRITDLTPLVKLKNLTGLDVSKNEITDLSPLSRLKNLTELYIDTNRITDLAPLAKLKKLTILDVSNNEITDLSPLSRLKELAKFQASENKIIDLTPLSKLKNLTILDVSKNKITDLSPLSRLKKLRDLNISKNQISVLSPLVRLKRLKALNISKNQISDITPLAGLEHLYWLDLEKNRVSDFRPVDHVPACVGCVDELPTNRVETRVSKQEKGVTIKLKLDRSKYDANEMFVGEMVAPFFSDPQQQLNFSHDSRLSQHITEEEWRLLDQEFLRVWNEHPASKTPVWKKNAAFMAGAYCWFCIWPCFFSCKVMYMDTKRESVIEETIAMANKYVLGPRGMFMKRRQEACKVSIKGTGEGIPSNDSKVPWMQEYFYVAIGPDAIASLKRQDIYNWEEEPKEPSSPQEPEFQVLLGKRIKVIKKLESN